MDTKMKYYNRIKYLTLISLIFAAQIIFAQSLPELSAVKVEIAPVIDGFVNESIWEKATVADNFIQYEPNRGVSSFEMTKVQILYDDKNLYVAFSLWEKNDLIAQLTDRDANLQNDDAVIILLDTYNNKQSAYYFATNLLATQSDGTIINNGNSTDESWDGNWISSAQRTDFGWSAEFAIPFSTIKYQSGTSQDWGINFGRTRPEDLELSYWSNPTTNPYQISQAGTLTNLVISKASKKHRLIAYGIASADNDKNLDGDVGLDLQYNFTPQISGYATVNPDFATVEADEAEINLTKYELSLSEKRPFFIDGNELYDQRIKTFYSRRIGDISGGAKFLGRIGTWTMAGLSTLTNNNSNFENFTVGRLQRDIYHSSNIAFMASNKNYLDKNEGSFGMDANLIYNDQLSMTTQISNSYGSYDTGNWAYFFRPAYDTPTSHFHLRYTNLGEYFAENVNSIGYIKDDDRKEFDSAIEKEFWIRKHAIDKITYDSNYNIFWSQSDVLRSWEIVQALEMELSNRISGEFKLIENYELSDGEDFQNTAYEFELAYNKREFQSVVFKYEFGENFGLDFQLIECELGYKVTPSLSLEYSLTNLKFSPDPEGESTWIHLIRANQFFTKDLYLKTFYQIDTKDKQQDLQVIFVYRYNPPFGSIQLVYQRSSDNTFQNTEENQTLFLKFSKVL